MIDFRYHLVSLIAVFMAIALGIIIGTTALNEPILADIERQVTDLEQDKRSLEDRTQNLQAQVRTADAFQDAVAPSLVAGSLTNRSVLLVVTDDAVAPETVERVSALVGQAGGTVSGTLNLQPEYSDPSTSSSLQSYATGSGLPAGVQLPSTSDAGQLVGSLLAQVLMIPATGAAAPDSASVSSVIAGLDALDVLSVASDSIAPANYAIVLTGGGFTGDDAADRTATVVDLVSALDAVGSGTVVSGDGESTADDALVGAIRADPALSAALSTVDNVASSAGRISTVLALGREGEGASGKYGTEEDAQPVPPVPAATP
ncbi:MAG TPA: copper transporter [Blastococcus sp.]